MIKAARYGDVQVSKHIKHKCSQDYAGRHYVRMGRLLNFVKRKVLNKQGSTSILPNCDREMEAGTLYNVDVMTEKNEKQQEEVLRGIIVTRSTTEETEYEPIVYEDSGNSSGCIKNGPVLGVEYNHRNKPSIAKFVMKHDVLKIFFEAFDSVSCKEAVPLEEIVTSMYKLTDAIDGASGATIAAILSLHKADDDGNHIFRGSNPVLDYEAFAKLVKNFLFGLPFDVVASSFFDDVIELMTNRQHLAARAAASQGDILSLESITSGKTLDDALESLLSIDDSIRAVRLRHRKASIGHTPYEDFLSTISESENILHRGYHAQGEKIHHDEVTMKKMNFLFYLFDMNNDGYIDVCELTFMLLKFHSTDEKKYQKCDNISKQCFQLLGNFDTDHDRRLNQREFYNFVQKFVSNLISLGLRFDFNGINNEYEYSFDEVLDYMIFIALVKENCQSDIDNLYLEDALNDFY